MGYTYLHPVIDGFSVLACTEALEDESTSTTFELFQRARVYFVAHGITRISRPATDNGANYTARASRRTNWVFIGRHQRTRIYTPRLIGKIGRNQRLSSATGG